MNRLSAAQLWQALSDQGLVQDQLPASGKTASPWYVRVMLGFAGWLGALFLLGFVGVAFAAVMKSAPASFGLGLACCVGAWVLFKAGLENDFADQFGLAVSLAGQGMIVVGLFNAFDHDTPATWFAVFLCEAVLALLIPNFLHRVLASWAAIAALWFALSKIGMHGAGAGIAAAGFAMVWLNEERWAGNGALWRPIGYGLALALLQIDAMLLGSEAGRLFSRHPGELVRYAPLIGAALTGAVFLASAWRLMEREKIIRGGRAGLFLLAAASGVALFSFAAHGLTAALLILMLGYAVGSRALAGLGLFALLGFLSHYYYQLQTTLLMKSMLLALAGIVLLAARVLSHRLFPRTEQTGEHDA